MVDSLTDRASVESLNFYKKDRKCDKSLGISILEIGKIYVVESFNIIEYYERYLEVFFYNYPLKERSSEVATVDEFEKEPTLICSFFIPRLKYINIKPDKDMQNVGIVFNGLKLHRFKYQDSFDAYEQIEFVDVNVEKIKHELPISYNFTNPDNEKSLKYDFSSQYKYEYNMQINKYEQYAQ